MIEAQYKTGNGRLMFRVTGESSKQVFEHLADLSEVFEAETACGCCNSQRIRFAHRVVAKGPKKFDYYELHCLEQQCRARFAFGQLSDGSGGLFPKRRDKSGEWMKNRGWSRYNAAAPQDDDDYNQEAPPEQEQPSRQQAPPPAGTRQSANDLAYGEPPPPRSQRR